MTQARTIAVLMHAQQLERDVSGYLVWLLAQVWREDGHQVHFLFGCDAFEPADVAILHVDLSVVPDEYLALAARYPVALNGRKKDTRKSTYSPGLLQPGDDWVGQVIVKSNFNYAGLPERRLLGPATTAPKEEDALRLDHPVEYPIFDDISLVPAEHFRDPALVVQKFVPELERGRYCVRALSFLGDRVSFMRMKSAHPIVSGHTIETVERIDPDPELLAMRAELELDYGKIDYVMTRDGPMLLDVNKTVGVAANLVDDPALAPARRERARGLYDYFR